jgi:hypothetical protein
MSTSDEVGRTWQQQTLRWATALFLSKQCPHRRVLTDTVCCCQVRTALSCPATRGVILIDCRARRIWWQLIRVGTSGGGTSLPMDQRCSDPLSCRQQQQEPKAGE